MGLSGGGYRGKHVQLRSCLREADKKAADALCWTAQRTVKLGDRYRFLRCIVDTLPEDVTASELIRFKEQIMMSYQKTIAQRFPEESFPSNRHLQELIEGPRPAKAKKARDNFPKF